jgi:hypothetical protein
MTKQIKILKRTLKVLSHSCLPNREPIPKSTTKGYYVPHPWPNVQLANHLPRQQPVVHQQTHTELLTTSQIDEAKKMGIKLDSAIPHPTQYDLLRITKWQHIRPHACDKFTKKLVKQHGRKKAKLILKEMKENKKVA